MRLDRWMVIVALLVVETALGQMPIFQRIGHRSGLVFGEIHCMARDRSGSLWIGTAMGLSRYDGSGFRTFTVHDGLPAPRIRHIRADNQGRLWLATVKGLARIDPGTLEIRSWHMDLSGDVLNDHLWNVLPLPDGRVICAATTRTFIFDPVNGSSTTIKDEDLGEIVLQGHVLMDDSSGTGFWISARDHGLLYVNVRDGRVFHKGNSTHPLLQGLKVNTAYRETDGALWLDDPTTGGLMHYRPANRHLQRWPHLPADPDITFPSGLIVIHKDRKGRLWMGGWDLHMVVFDPTDSSATSLVADPMDPSKVQSPLMAALVEDDQGVIWIGTFNGLAIHDPRSVHYNIRKPGDHVPQTIDREVNSMYQAPDGTSWYATWQGLLRYDPIDHSYEHVLLPEEGWANAILDIVERDGLFWLATHAGLRVFDPIDRKLVKIPALPDTSALSTRSIPWLVKDNEDRIWCWTRRIGILGIDPASGTIIHIPEDPAGKMGPTPGGVICAAPSTDGRIWLGLETAGMSWIDPRTGEYHSLQHDVITGELPSARILTLTEDHRGHIWGIADGAGLFKYDVADRRYTLYDERHGLPVPAGSSILPDQKGRLWIGTLKGLGLFDPERERIITMRIDAGGGDPRDDVGKCAYRAPDGRFHFSVDHIMIDLDPLSFDLPPPPLKPVIHSLQAGDAIIRPDPAGPIVLDHDQDRIGLRFSSFDVPGRIVRYAIRELTDSVWHDGPESEVTIGRLEPGEHHFQLRTMAADGQWSPAADLRIAITPPWWRTPVFRISFAIVFAGLLVLLFRLRLNIIRKRERRQESFARTVNELRLRALRAQMDPHFVFNCMNSIDRYILMNEPEKASRYLNRFAKLVRLILHQSDHVTVPLEKEAEMLDHYLELESLRFDVPFTYEVITDPLLEREEPEIPAMLVQPYVENAIWHGLQHKKGKGHVRVEFRKLGDAMVVTIEDDGVGRAEAARIKAGRSSVHSSKGMQVNADRLALLKELDLEGSSVIIDDLLDREGKALGTRVTITLPLEVLHESTWTEQE